MISTTSYFHRDETSGYDGTLYNLGYYQTLGTVAFPLLDGSGVHLPPGLQNYRAPASVTNQQSNMTQEFRLQSTDPASRLGWTAGVFYSLDRQYSLEEIHDPMADAFFNQLLGENIATFFGTALNPDGSSYLPMGDSYFNQLVSHDRQIAGFGEAEFQADGYLEADRRRARLENHLQHREPVGRTAEQRAPAGHAAEQRDSGHAQGGHRMAGRPE